jgi:transposase
MYLRPNLKDGNVYWNIVESVTTPKGPRQNIIKHLGKLTDAEVAAIRLWLKAFPSGEGSSLLINPTSVSVPTTLLHGGPFLPWSFAVDLGLADIIQRVIEGSRVEIPVPKLITAAAVNRCVDPVSKLELLYGWLPKTTLPRLLDLDLTKLNDNAIYRSMDALVERKLDLELALWEVLKSRYGATTNVLFYDLTSSYFEGDGPPMAAHGYSRDHRPDKPQIAIGLVITEQGYPVTTEIFPGNTQDKTTVERTCKRLRDEFKVAKCVFVGDRGMITDDNVKVIQDHEYNYIICQKERNIYEELVNDVARPLEEWKKVDDDLFVLDVERAGTRYILCCNPEKIEQDRLKREERLEKGMALVEEVRQMAVKGNVMDHDKLLRKIMKRLVKKDLDKYFDFDIPPTPARDFKTTVLKDKVDKEALFDGKWVIQTDIREHPADTIATMYKRLSEIERVFRTLKGELDIRPIFHRKDDRVVAHVLICQLAYLLMVLMDRQAKESRLDMTSTAMVRAFSNVTLNEVTMGPENKVHVWRVTGLDEEQRRIMLALGLKNKALRSFEKVEFAG